MKDLNWEENKRLLELGPIKRKILLDQVDKDTKASLYPDTKNFYLMTYLVPGESKYYGLQLACRHPQFKEGKQ
jgi:hypothetical protein